MHRPWGLLENVSRSRLSPAPSLAFVVLRAGLSDCQSPGEQRASLWPPQLLGPHPAAESAPGEALLDTLGLPPYPNHGI